VDFKLSIFGEPYMQPIASSGSHNSAPPEHRPSYADTWRKFDYLELIDWTGRAIRDDKRGYISEHAPPILYRIDISPEHWVEICTNFESRLKGLVELT